MIKGSQRVKHSQKHSHTRKTNHHQPLPPVTTPTLSCSVSHGAPSVLQSALHSSASLWSQDKDLSLSRSLTQSVWSTPRCVHLELWLKRNDIYKTQPRFSWAVIKPASDSDCINKGCLVSKCLDYRFTCHGFWHINISTGRVEMNSHLQPNAGRHPCEGFEVLHLIIQNLPD